MLKIYYDQGWNAFIDNEPFDPKATRDWKDGWFDCKYAEIKDRVKI